MSRSRSARADDGQRRRRGMGAALGAAGDVDRERPVEKRRRCRGDRRRHGAGGDVRRRADRRSGTGDDVAARIAGAHDEAELLGVGGKGAARAPA